MSDLQTLYRPVGLLEMLLILETDGKAFPPRLEWQPIFYPVLDIAYARQIASGWNVKDAFSGHAGFVTTFQMPREYVAQFDEHIVGNSTHRELWVPAEQVAEFSQQIRGRVAIVEAYYGPPYIGPAGESALEGLDIRQQFLALANMDSEAMADELRQNAHLVQVNYAYWAARSRSEVALQAIRAAWDDLFPGVALPGSK